MNEPIDQLLQRSVTALLDDAARSRRQRRQTRATNHFAVIVLLGVIGQTRGYTAAQLTTWIGRGRRWRRHPGATGLERELTGFIYHLTKRREHSR